MFRTCRICLRRGGGGKEFEEKIVFLFFFFFKQKTAYEIYQCDWSSDVCSSDLTETAAIANMSKAIEFIACIKQMGCKFSLDDFGSGLNSFSYLKNMSVDNLKIDGMFIREIHTDPINKVFVESIHNISKIMGIKTTAEYVENEKILNCIKSIGIDYAQGYHISRPASVKNLLQDSFAKIVTN